MRKPTLFSRLITAIRVLLSLPFLTVLALTVLSVQGCGGSKLPKPPEPTTMQVYLLASKDLNSGSGRGALPVVVRMYELKSTGAFSGADFFSLYDHETETLGAELVAKDEIALTPGQDRRLEKTLPPDAAFLGVVAAFRDIDRSQWRDIAVLKPNYANKVTITVSADSITVATQ
ncbi:type VI secretion system lipoprotein TssJ [Thiocapsa bogorovii]|uniref:type VI secretion system lipoprotein TssJ n=1 Tax=Thiocapsa bogorovii TaxID=521689 RepID=UPI001E3C5237|nr:type VI secretion system lipoprotein TssJ [Thiocapsa bogorovii]UHD16095.1 type VI secretion system lipoprotein TssJ [Thiocapsa bogorovii]